MRDIKTAGPFCWLQKTALRRIREAFDATGDTSTALSVYLALVEIASDLQREEFSTTHGYIGQKSGLARRTVQYRLKTLAEIGVISISTPKMKTASTYTLTQLPEKRVSSRKSDAHPMRNDAHGMRHDAHATRRTLEESYEQAKGNQKCTQCATESPDFEEWRKML